MVRSEKFICSRTRRVEEDENHSGATVLEKYCIKEARSSLTLGDADTKMRAYIKALRKADTAVNVNIVLAAAEGVVTAVDMLRGHL